LIETVIAYLAIGAFC